MPFDTPAPRIYPTAAETPVGGLFVRPGLEGCVRPLRRYREGLFGFVPTEAEERAEKARRLAVVLAQIDAALGPCR